MKVELMGALLHRPNVVYLDEPTIGLDISAQKAVRSFLKGYQKEFRPIVLLTSHYMEDIKELCPRVVLMKSGGVIYDGALATVQARFGDKKRLVVRLEAGTPAVAGPWALELQEDGSHALSVERSRLKEAVDHLLQLRPTDLTVQDPPVEEVIEALMHAGGPA
jgi:ABC-2 type transport system ATP-binding protein